MLMSLWEVKMSLAKSTKRAPNLSIRNNHKLITKTFKKMTSTKKLPFTPRKIPKKKFKKGLKMLLRTVNFQSVLSFKNKTIK